MILENKTRYRSADLEAVILAALREFGVDRHGRDRVVVTYARKPWGYSGCAWIGKDKPNGFARMYLRLPNPDRMILDMKNVVHLVRHEVAHWAGLKHSQMAKSLRYWNEGTARDMPAWAIDMAIAVEDAPPAKPSKPKLDKLAHYQAMLARATRRRKLAETIEKRWARRVKRALRTKKGSDRVDV